MTQHFEAQLGHQPPITTINLCGHSRGAVTATVVAWAIQKLLVPHMRNLKVNMFLFDPVAGAKNSFKGRITYQGHSVVVDRTRLPDVVKNFAGILQSNIKSGGKDHTFHSTMPKANNLNADRYRVYSMPGGHNAAVKYNPANGGSSIGRIGVHLAFSFLTKHGSQFTFPGCMTAPQILECYAQARNPAGLGLPKLKATHQDQDFCGVDNKQKTSTIRNNFAHRVYPNIGHDFYVNRHHEEVFKTQFPRIGLMLRLNGSLTKDDAQVLGKSKVVPLAVQALDQLGLVA